VVIVRRIPLRYVGHRLDKIFREQITRREAHRAQKKRHH
jgi:hypothetical protein